jgi:hypothetical protein
MAAMGAFLIPSSGGDAIPLRKSRIYLGRRKDSDPAAPPNRETALFMLELIEGWWHIEDLNSPTGIRVGGIACKRQKLAPDDEIELGRHRYRIKFEAPKYSFGRSPSGNFQVAAKRPALRKSSSNPHAIGVLGRLVPLGGGENVPLLKPRITVGRRAPCDVVIERPTVSSRHCELELVEGYWRVKDLDSRNGTRIDGERCTEGWVLPDGRLTIGDQRYRLEYTAVGPPPEVEDVRLGGSLTDKIGLAEADLERIARSDADEIPAQAKPRWDLLKDLQNRPTR